MCWLTEAAWNAERTGAGRETFLGKEVLSELRPEDGGMLGVAVVRRNGLCKGNDEK